MFIRSVLVSAAMVALCGFAPRQEEWKRVQVGDTPVSLEIPGKKFTAGEVERSEAQGDWVATSQDFDFENDDYFVKVTAYQGRPGTKVDATFLKNIKDSILRELVLSHDLTGGTSSNRQGNTSVENMKTRGLLAVLSEDTKDMNEKTAVRGVYNILPNNPDENTEVSLTLVGDGEKLYCVSIISFPSVKAGSESAARSHKSVEFKGKA